MAAKKGNLLGQLRPLLPSSACALAHLRENGAALNRLREGQKLLEDYAARGTVQIFNSGMEPEPFSYESMRAMFTAATKP
jgi:hypothetical protein